MSCAAFHSYGQKRSAADDPQPGWAGQLLDVCDPGERSGRRLVGREPRHELLTVVVGQEHLVGDAELALGAGPGRGYQPDPDAGAFLIAGDESAVPAISTILDALPTRAHAHVVIEVESADDEQPLPVHQNLTTEWLHRDGRPPGRLLEDHLKTVDVPMDTGRVWVAGEATVIRSLRTHLVSERRLAARHVVTRGYWRAGHANHPDHDTGTDAL